MLERVPSMIKWPKYYADKKAGLNLGWSDLPRSRYRKGLSEMGSTEMTYLPVNYREHRFSQERTRSVHQSVASGIGTIVHLTVDILWLLLNCMHYTSIFIIVTQSSGALVISPILLYSQTCSILSHMFARQESRDRAAGVIILVVNRDWAGGE